MAMIETLLLAETAELRAFRIHEPGGNVGVSGKKVITGDQTPSSYSFDCMASENRVYSCSLECTVQAGSMTHCISMTHYSAGMVKEVASGGRMGWM